MLAEMGFLMCDADRVAHELMGKGCPVYQTVVDCFGEGILSPDGEISRARLGEVVFDDSSRLQLLNRIVHPAVRETLVRWISGCRAERIHGAAQVPLLFESGMHQLGWDAVVCVSSSEPLMIERLKARGLNRSEAEKRIASQMPLAEKEQLADQIIRNLGTLRELKTAVQECVNSLCVER